MSPSQSKEEEEEEEEEEVEYEEVSEEEEEEEEVEYVEVSEEEEEEEKEEEEVEYVEVSEEEEDEEQNPNPNQKSKPSVLESINHLESLHGALSDFLLNYNSLQETLDSINSSIDSPKIKEAKDGRQYSELESICLSNCVKALRKYITNNLSEIDHLRGEVPEALKLASDPEKLVLGAMGKFYLQGSRAYNRGDIHAIDARLVSTLLLEFYVLAGCPAAEEPLASVKESARNAAVSWRSRLITEGGIEAAGASDALGLALLVAAFGIPTEFSAKDVYALLRLSNLRTKRDVFRRSHILVEKMPGIIKYLIVKGMLVEAVDLVCAFGLEEKFPPLSLLSSFVKKAYEVVEERREGQCSLNSLKEANEKQLAALKSVVKCLEDYKLDTTELDSLEINQKIAQCEKEILKLKQKIQDKNVKRKFEDGDPLKNQDSQTKQLRPSAEASHGPLPQSVKRTQQLGITAIYDSRYAYQEQGITAIYDSRYTYDGYIVNDMPVSSEASHELAHRNSMGLLTQNVHGPAGEWHGNTVCQNSVGQSSLGTPYSSGYDYARYSAAGGHNFYRTPASGQNFYQPPEAGQNSYQVPTSGQNIYQPTASGQNIYQPPVSEQNIYQPPALGQNIHQPPALGQNIHQPPAPEHNIYQTYAPEQNIYQTCAPEQNIYQPSASGQNIYQTYAPEKNIYQTYASEQNIYQPPASGQKIYQTPASEQNVYQPPASGQNIQPPASDQNVHQQPPASVQNTYQPPASEQNVYQQPPASVQNIYQQPPASAQNTYQPPASEQNTFQPPAAEKNTYQAPASKQNICQPPAAEQSIYQPPATEQSIYQPPATEQIIYQTPESGQNVYQPPASSLVAGGSNQHQFGNIVSELELPTYSTNNAAPTAITVTNPNHQSS